MTINIEDNGKIGLNYRQDASNYEGGRVNIILNPTGDIDEFELEPPGDPKIPDDITPPDPVDRGEGTSVSGVEDAVNGLIEVSKEGRYPLYDAEGGQHEDHVVINELRRWITALDEVESTLLDRLVASPTDELVEYTETFIENINTLSDEGGKLFDARAEDPEDDPDKKQGQHARHVDDGYNRQGQRN